jgi:transposase
MQNCCLFRLRWPLLSHRGRRFNRGADRAAAMAPLIMTAKLNDIDPQAWLADVFARIASLPQARLREFLPWNWSAHVRSVAPPQAA